jgi:cytochrome c oxidase subunit II
MIGALVSSIPAQVFVDDPPSVLQPVSEIARRIEGLWWLMFWLGSAVWVLVMAVLALTFTRRSRERGATWWNGQPLVVAGGIALPVVILVPLLVVTFDVAAQRDVAAGEDGVEIEIVGHQFWWEIRYPGVEGAVTANEVHVPVGRPVTLVLTSNDVIHSFWVPNVAGKQDLNPGETTRLRFTVDVPGTYFGVCAEYCGIQHALMRKILVAQPSEEFDAWLAGLARPASPPVGERQQAGFDVFMRVGCASCHALRGTAAVGDLGPDLTHFAARATIGAGVLPNTRGNLAGWVANAQAVKPGALMPPSVIEADELHHLLDYLESLG